MIIGISGKIGSGKDTVGEIIRYLISYQINGGNWSYPDGFKLNIQYTESKWEIKKFADKLKDIVCLLIGCTREQLEDQEFKSTPLGKEWDKYIVHSDGVPQVVSSGYYYSTHKTKEIVKTTPRLLLQLLGTECGRDIIHPNIWVNALFADYDPGYTISPLDVDNQAPDNWIITDMRFPNELKAVKDRDGISIRVERDLNCSLCNGAGCTHCYNGKVQNQGNHESETALDNAKFDYTIDNNNTIEDLIEKVKEILIKEKII